MDRRKETKRKRKYKVTADEVATVEAVFASVKKIRARLDFTSLLKTKTKADARFFEKLKMRRFGSGRAFVGFDPPLRCSSVFSDALLFSVL